MAQMTAPQPDISFLSYSRWRLKRGADINDALNVFQELVRPAYTAVPGCLELRLLDLVDSQSYLAVAGWDTRDDYDAWVRQGDDWREQNAGAFDAWRAVMDFEEEFQASIVAAG
jgi:hypothetical protein